jgi:hypothetical protein
LPRRQRFLPAPISKSCSLHWHRTVFNGVEDVLFGTPLDSEGDLSHSFDNLRGSQTPDSETHPSWNIRSKRPGWYGDIGGDFSTVKNVVVTPVESQSMDFHRPSRVPGVKDHVKWHGPILPCRPLTLQFPDISTLTLPNGNLDAAGATAIARCSPVNPTVDLTTFLGELLHEGLPKLGLGTLKELRGLTNRRRRKALAGMFLNFEFGWKPFVSDISSFAERIVDADARIRQMMRDSGKMVRRRYEFPLYQSTVSQDWSREYGPWGSAPNTDPMYTSDGEPGMVVRVDKVTRRTWFSGGFSYYIPSGGDTLTEMARQVELAKGIAGLSFTPESIWNLTPWSWLVDWVTNTGDVLANVDSVILFNQVLLYGYIMQHTVAEATYTYVGKSNFWTGNVAPSVTLVSESKVRRKATPYGFGVSWDKFSKSQLAILGALGVTRTH